MYSKMPTKRKICIFFRFGLPTNIVRESNSLDQDQDRRFVGPDPDPNCLKCYKQNTLACKELLKINCLLISLPIHCNQPFTRGSAHPDKNKTPRSRCYLSASFEHISKTECFSIYPKNIVLPYSCNLQMTYMFR